MNKSIFFLFSLIEHTFLIKIIWISYIMNIIQITPNLIILYPANYIDRLKCTYLSYIIYDF